MAGMSTLSDLVTETIVDLSGYGAANDRATFNVGPAAGGALSLTVTDGAALTQGIAEVGDELIYIESVSGDTVTVAPDGRGYYGTAAAPIPDKARVTMEPTWSRARVAASLNTALAGLWPTLFGVGVTTFVQGGVQAAYEVPADVDSIITVTATNPSPSKEPTRVRHYRLDTTAASGFTTGRSLTVAGVFPGSTVTVTYRKVPTELGLSDDFRESGLSVTAKLAVKLGAMSELVLGLDGERLVSESAQGYEYGTHVPVGTATKLSTQYFQRYTLEVERERVRQAVLAKPAIVWVP